MAEIVNLNRARKARAKADAKRTAEANRLTTQTERERDAAQLDGHKLEKPDDA